MPYRGRFAPSPTGPLHFGSLVTALASYLDARASGGEWLVRIDDLDTPRTVPGADRDILQTLKTFGFAWDGEVIYQSRRTELYRAALETLRIEGMAYPCSCSRREAGAGAYPGTCRKGPANPGRPLSWRVRTDDDDFVVLRSDGIFAYQLAVVVDDADQQITDVVRGADLLDSVARQMLLQKLLRLPHPRYLHVPIATDAAGAKLSKEKFAAALNAADPSREINEALQFLGQPTVKPDAPTEMLRVAVSQWNREAIPRGLSAPRTGVGFSPGLQP